ATCTGRIPGSTGTIRITAASKAESSKPHNRICNLITRKQIALPENNNHLSSLPMLKPPFRTHRHQVIPTESTHAVRHQAARVGPARLLHSAGDEGRTRLLRRHDPVGGSRHPGGHPLEAGNPVGGRPHPCAEADPLPVDPPERGRAEGPG